MLGRQCGSHRRTAAGYPDEVYAASMKCIEVARNGGSLILSSGCEVPRHTAGEHRSDAASGHRQRSVACTSPRGIAVLGKDRCLRALKGQKVRSGLCSSRDRLQLSAPLCGASVSDCFLDPKLHAGALEHVFQVHNDIDGLYVNLCLSPTVITKTERSGRDSYATDISGAVWRIPANDVGTVTSNAIVNLDDRRLKTVDPLRAGINETYAHLPRD